jgi:prepilin-type N-terminal cleavage/methylation domain-containing protein
MKLKLMRLKIAGMLKKQAGMTMVELIIAVAITGIIITFTGTAVYQILNVSGYGNDHLSSGHELQNAGAWFQFDIQGTVSATAGSQLVMTISDNSTVTYSLVSNELLRSNGSVQTTVARNISSASFSISGRLATMNLTCVPSWRDSISNNGTYMAYMRPVESTP